MKNETLEEAAENYGWRIKTNTFSDPVKANELANSAKQDFVAGANYQSERMYREEEVLEILFELSCNSDTDKEEMEERFEQFKKK